MKKKRISWRLPVAAFALGLVACMGTTPVKAEGDVAINDTNFPDKVFRWYVGEYEDVNKDGVLSQSELSDTSMNVYAYTLTDQLTQTTTTTKATSLQGIEYFTALEDLYLSNTDLTSLDLSKNTKLSYISGLSSNENLTSLDLSNNTALKKLGSYYYDDDEDDYYYYAYLPESLTSLNVSGATALTSLVCSDLELTSLNVSGATALTSLYCSGNELTSLDVSTNTKLTTLSCSNNDLAALDVSKNTELESLTCSKNGLTSLDVSANKKLESLTCSNNALTSLNVTGAEKLESLTCSNNDLASLNTSGAAALTSLTCSNNGMTSLDVSGNTKLTSLYCSNNKLTALTVSANTKLTSLSCYENELTSLDVSANTKLRSLSCGDNQLTSLNVEKNNRLDSLSCSNVYEMRTLDGKLDLTTLPGFNVDNASDWNGGSVSNNVLTLNDVAGSASYTYDCGNGFKETFTIKNLHDHQNGTLVSGKAATCVEDGEKDYYVCECGYAFEDQACTNRIRNLGTWKVIRATGVHTKVTQKVDGKTQVVCAVCGQIMTDVKTVSSVTLSKTSYTYNGKAKKPSVKALNEDGKKISSKYYTVKYAKGRKNVGTYTVKVTFKGKYTGSETLSFTINPKATSISKVTAGKKKLTVKWKKVTAQTTGYQIQYSTDNSFKSSKTVTISKNKTTSKAISKLTAKKKYYVRIRTYKTVKKVKYYSSWSKVKSATTK